MLETTHMKGRPTMWSRSEISKSGAVISGMARTAMATLGGYAIAQGVISEQDYLMIVGASGTIGAAIWSVWEKVNKVIVGRSTSSNHPTRPG